MNNKPGPSPLSPYHIIMHIIVYTIPWGQFMTILVWSWCSTIIKRKNNNPIHPSIHSLSFIHSLPQRYDELCIRIRILHIIRTKFVISYGAYKFDSLYWVRIYNNDDIMIIHLSSRKKWSRLLYSISIKLNEGSERVFQCPWNPRGDCFHHCRISPSKTTASKLTLSHLNIAESRKVEREPWGE